MDRDRRGSGRGFKAWLKRLWWRRRNSDLPGCPAHGRMPCAECDWPRWRD